MHKSGLLKSIKERLLAFDGEGMRTAISKDRPRRRLDEIGARYEKGK